MIARIWSATFDPSSQDALETFARERSLPYLHGQPGNLGLIYLVRDNVWLTITFWTDRSAVEAMEARKDYQTLARDIEMTDARLTVNSLEVFDVREFRMPNLKAT